MNQTVFAERRKKAGENMENQSLLFLLAGHPKQKSLDQDYPFEINRNFYYMTGYDRKETILLLTKINGEVKEYLFIERPDPYIERYHGKMPDTEAAGEITGIGNVCYLDKFDWEMGRMLSRNAFRIIYFDFQQLDLSILSEEKKLCDHITQAHPYLQIRTLSQEICNMRRVKDPEEHEMILKAIEATKSGILSILDHLKDGVNERQLEAWFELGIKLGQANGNGFDPIIAGGRNSVFLHYSNNDQDLHDGDVLLVDLGADYGHYSADISRTFPVRGSFTEEQAFYYNVVLHGQEAVFKFLKPGAYLPDAVKVAREAMGRELLEAGRISDLSEMESLLPHGVSHGIGLDVHDVGDNPWLEPGMIVTVEPGIYLPDQGLGIRIEDDVLITEDGCRPLSLDIPRSIEEIETYMAERNGMV